ncbi:MAG: tetratricopeptide repeat protein, partial [Candidatus Brocadiales bacterium]|nr:tetratricopeptide repeat protein [Candidatus Brocadiales bacterium]
KQGKIEEAVLSFEKAIYLNPEDYKAHSNLATTFKETGRLEEAMASCNQAISLNPQYAEAFNNLGTIHQKSGDLRNAIENYETALKIKPESYEVLANLGSALKGLNRLEDAATCCRRAIELNPENADAHSNLGTILQEEGVLDKAIECYKQAICLKPDHSMAHGNLGTALQKQGETEESEINCRQAVTLDPNSAYLHNNLGVVLQEQGKFDEAITCHNRAIELDPDSAEAYSNLGAIFKKQGFTEKALTNLRKSLLLKPDSAEVHKTIGILLEEQGRTDEALFSYQESLRLRPDPGIEIKSVLLHPVINDSRKSINLYRENLFKQIESLKQKNLSIEDPPGQVGSTNFYLAYHGLNEKEVQEKVAALYMDVCPDLVWTSPDLNEERPQSYEKINIGIISHYLTNHTIGLLNHGIIKHLSRERFHVTLFRFIGEEINSVSEAINSDADEVVVLPRKLKPARQEIAEHSLDILFYLDIGMDPLAYFLAFSRLAPVQCTTWGHPITTGIPNIDYFISSKMAELPEAEEHYSEQLILPDILTTYYYRPQLPEDPRSREYFGISEGYNLYVCPQTLFKFHPDFDKTLGTLLRRDQQGLLVLIEGKHKTWTEMLLNRFSGVFPDVIDRVKFITRMQMDDYMSLLNIADVLLDPPHYGGGNTSLEAFAFGIPLVTWPGEFLRSRLTLALYRQMNIMDCVAYDSQTYLEIAYRLANDPTWRNEITGKIKAKADCLFENIETVHELERFFEMAIQKVPNNNLLLEKQLS